MRLLQSAAVRSTAAMVMAGAVLVPAAAGSAPAVAAVPADKPADKPAEPADKPASKTVLVVGDSLSAEYGIRRGSGWVALLAERLARHQPPYRVVNASISGDTTSGGVNRLAPLLTQHRPAVVILELGANDALRGLSLTLTQRNLETMARQARAAGAKVLVVGMQIPPNYGRDFAQRFSDLFVTVARQEDAALVPFFMEGLAADRSHFQPDGLHPNEAAQPRLFDNVWPHLVPLL